MRLRRDGVDVGRRRGRAARGSSCRSSAPRSATSCSSASCWATAGAPSRARRRGEGAAGAVLRRHGLPRRGGRADAGAPRRSCSARSRTARSAALARTAPSGSTCGSWPPRTGRWTTRLRPAVSRKDLLYRGLGVVGLTAVPLRGRRADVARPSDQCWKDIAAAAGNRATLARETATVLAARSWPADVRGVQRVVANLTVAGSRYGPSVPTPCRPPSGGRVAAERRPTLAEARGDLEHAMARDALGRHGSATRAAGELGVTRQRLSELMARLPVDRVDPTREPPPHALSG